MRIYRMLLLLVSVASSFQLLSMPSLRRRLDHHHGFAGVLLGVGFPRPAAPISSPFENFALDDEEDDELDPDVELPLTLENVERVLDELRPYLMSDGGNVRVAAIDGPVVRLELEGACGTCPSSTMTMKMGLERRLKEVIPEISEVVQALPSAPDLTLDGVNEVLDGVRPFLSVAGGQVDVVDLSGVTSIQPTLLLSITGKSASLHSVRTEITQRIQRYFMTPGLRVEWSD
mmetsp:Transcript_8519/g.27913  ORF Transcript_8519/g.27913 Transcript_8519/m.27913 type:complete len:231 (+) Transcript_8519:126-818(+)